MRRPIANIQIATPIDFSVERPLSLVDDTEKGRLSSQSVSPFVKQSETIYREAACWIG